MSKVLSQDLGTGDSIHAFLTKSAHDFEEIISQSFTFCRHKIKVTFAFSCVWSILSVWIINSMLAGTPSHKLFVKCLVWHFRSCSS